MEVKFLKDALFNAMTANAFKLGTVLTLGWFWQRLSGCSVLYRGLSMETIDFDNMLAVAEINAIKIYVPDYVNHTSDTAYFYVVRRANSCGNLEYTVAAAVKVAIDVDGNLAPGRPNNIFKVKACQIADNKIELLWFYSPIAQQSKPVCFNVYCDDGTGQIDYENPIAKISYKGPNFYSYRSSTLSASFEQVSIQLNDTTPVTMDIIDSNAI
ncbi:MAG: hypothetical protein ACYSYU_01590 [Planctomycetota bacterium]|jgi:hypothetical protein